MISVPLADGGRELIYGRLGGVFSLAEVRLQDGETLENALRRFKRKVQQEDIIKEVKRHSFYLKPGEKMRVKQALARKRNRKKVAGKSNNPQPGGANGKRSAFSPQDGAMAEFQDRALKCVDCGTDFVFTAGEQQFYHEKNFRNEPKRCKACKTQAAERSFRTGRTIRDALKPRPSARNADAKPPSRSGPPRDVRSSAGSVSRAARPREPPAG